MKASAGSGKTWSLTREYIRLLLLDIKNSASNFEKHNAHRHILAVTFTNKATDEMKSRIVDELDTLANYTHLSDYTDYLLQNCGFENQEELTAASSLALHSILNDYGSFSVSTIDKFFQQTLRTFSREIGQTCEYRVELDRDSLVSESVDRLLDSLDEDRKDILKWLSDSSIEKIEAGEGYHLESNLNEFAKGRLSSSFGDKMKRYRIDEAKAFSEENITRLAKNCRKIVRTYSDSLEEASRRLVDAVACASRSLPPKAVSPYMVSKADDLLKNGVRASDFEVLSEKGYWKSYGLNKKYDARVDAPALKQAVDDIDAIRDRYSVFATAAVIDRQIYVFRVADALKHSFESLLAEKNVLGIDDTNEILRDIIDNTEVPFIYERTGNRYKYFLLDEFQDTSSIQWECFKPLLLNSISEGCYNLIVGDVKQSIYRWRDADWHILGSQVAAQTEGKGELEQSSLDKNFRSTEAVVKFNNGFYSFLSEDKDYSSSIGEIYQKGDVEQELNDRFGVKGCVDVAWYDDDVTDYVADCVRDAISLNFRPRDIAVIVRTNSMGAKVAQMLTSEGIDIITNDSLKICNAVSVRQIVSCMFRYDDSSDIVNGFLAPEEVDYTCLSGSRSISETAELLIRQLPEEQVEEDSLYILAFMDLVRDFVANNGNSLHSFLKYWKEEGMNRSVSCPEESDAVTIITIHKCKGLAFPYVILPLQHPRKGSDPSWEYPELEACAEFEGCEPALFRVALSSKSENTLFSKAWREEDMMRRVDDVNTWYVAMTRASQQMTILSPKVMKGFIGKALLDYVKSPESGFKSVGLAAGQTDHFLLGERSDKYIRLEDPSKERKPVREKGHIDIHYVPEEGYADLRGRIRISQDAREYFPVSGDLSLRRRGVLLHSVLEGVTTADTLPVAMLPLRHSGLLSQQEADAEEMVLRDAIEQVSEYGWFSDNVEIVAERDILLPDGHTVRPDRVVIHPDGRVDIIDYKFGSENGDYLAQVAYYMNLYREMGYCSVKGYIWYVESNHIVFV